jgi:hypothetical protein
MSISISSRGPSKEYLEMLNLLHALANIYSISYLKLISNFLDVFELHSNPYARNVLSKPYMS